MGIVDFLTPEGPAVELQINMNTVYFRIDRNLWCDSSEASGVEIAYTACHDDWTPDPELGSGSYYVPNWNNGTIYESDEVKDYNFRIAVDNHKYIFTFNFLYEFLDKPEKPLIFYSEATKIKVDNTKPVIGSFKGADLIVGDVKRYFELNPGGYLNIYYDAVGIDLTSAPEDSIVARHGGLVLTQVPNKFIREEFRLLARYILDHDKLPDIINSVFDDVILPDAELEFKLLCNKEVYLVKLIGNLGGLNEL